MAESRCREAGMGFVAAMALIGKGELALAVGDHAGAIRALDEARGMVAAGPMRNPRLEGMANRLLGRVAIAQGQFERARAYLERAMAIATLPEQDNWIAQGLIHEATGEWHQAQGDTASASEAYRQAGEIYHRMKNRHRLHAVNQRLNALLGTPTLQATVPQAAPAEATPSQTEDRFLQLRAMQMRGF
jgi:ATP/maltotriose-dependent transcriptional regulator MalT